jgi:hypothetical protein
MPLGETPICNSSSTSRSKIDAGKIEAKGQLKIQ